MTAQHTIDIAVDHSHGQVEGYRADGRSGVVAHALQPSDLFISVGESAHRHNLAGGKVKVAGPAVVAQALPLAQHLVLSGRSQVADGGPAAHEPQPVVPSLPDLRLLQDDLREPHGIGVAGLAPRQVASVLAKPSEQCCGKEEAIFSHRACVVMRMTLHRGNYRVSENLSDRPKSRVVVG